MHSRQAGHSPILYRTKSCNVIRRYVDTQLRHRPHCVTHEVYIPSSNGPGESLVAMCRVGEAPWYKWAGHEVGEEH